MKLSILIATYNRCMDLSYNLKLLENYILNNSLQDTVSILISNNASTDNTKKIIDTFRQTTSVLCETFDQSSNIGLERNVLFCLNHAISDFVMFLGDDDYIDERYLLAVLKAIAEVKDLGCVIPSFVGITPDKQVLPMGRDLGLKSHLYEKGFKACLVNVQRGHQLSGLTFRREGLAEAYMNAKVSNLYPQIFFLCYSALHGKVYHIPEYPTKVTQVPQSKKDWGYDNDGLIGDIFNNFKNLGLDPLKRSTLEFCMVRKQPWRFMMYYNRTHSLKSLLKSMWHIISGRNTSVLSSVVLPFYFALYLLKRLVKKLVKRI